MDNTTGRSFPVAWQRGEPAMPVLALLREAQRERFVPNSLLFDADFVNNAENMLQTADQPLPSAYVGGQEGGALSKSRLWAMAQHVLEEWCTNLYGFGGLLTPWNTQNPSGSVRGWPMRPSDADWTGLWPWHPYSGIPEGTLNIVGNPDAVAQEAGYADAQAWRFGGTPWAVETVSAQWVVYMREIIKKLHVWCYGNAGTAWDSWDADFDWLAELEYECRYYETGPPYQGTGTWADCVAGYNATAWEPCACGSPLSYVSYREDSPALGYDGASWAMFARRIKGGSLRIGYDPTDIWCYARFFAVRSFHQWYLAWDDLPELGDNDGQYPFELIGEGRSKNTLTVPTFEPPDPTGISTDHMTPGTSEGTPITRWWQFNYPHITADFKVPGGFVLV